jgi:hypothetical protein
MRLKALVVSIILLATAPLVLAQQTPSRETLILERIEALIQEWRTPPPPPPPPVVTIPCEGDLQAALAVGGSMVLTPGCTFTGNFTASAPASIVAIGATLVTPNVSPALTVTGANVTLMGGTLLAGVGAPTSDLVILTGQDITFLDTVLLGNGQTKRGISAQGQRMTFEGITIREIGRVGQESQAIAMWDGTGLTVRRSFLQAGSQEFLSGGSSPTVPNHVPADILFEDNVLSGNVAWRGAGYVRKTSFELKSARRVVVQRNIIEHVWRDAQTGFGITITPSQYGNSPDTIVEDVAFIENTIRFVGSGVNLYGFTQHNELDRQTLRARDIRFLRNTFEISKVWAAGGHGTLMQVGREPAEILIEGNTITYDGDSFLMMVDLRPLTGYRFLNNTLTRFGAYGIYAPSGRIRGLYWAEIAPGGLITGNTFTNAHSTFRQIFTENTYLVTP